MVVPFVDTPRSLEKEAILFVIRSSELHVVLPVDVEGTYSVPNVFLPTKGNLMYLEPGI